MEPSDEQGGRGEEPEQGSGLETDTERAARTVVRAVTLRLQGQQLVGRCPFHHGDEPTLTVDCAARTWVCLECGAGSGVELLMRAHGISRRHAAELLDRPPPVLAAPTGQGRLSGPTPDRTTRRLLDCRFDAEADDPTLLAQVVDFYHQSVLSSPQARRFLARRGLDDEALCRQHRLGFANRTIGYHVPDARRAVGARLRQRLRALGIYRSSGHEHLSGCLVVPVFDEGGAVVQLYGRKIIGRYLRNGKPVHLTLPGHRDVLWQAAVLGEHPTLIVCEGLLDALTLCRHGHPNVVSVLGPDGLTEEHAAVLSRRGVEQVVIAFDRDDEGDAGAGRAAELLTAQGLEVLRTTLPRGLDVNAYALSVDDPAKALANVVRHARWLGPGEAQPVRWVADAHQASGGAAQGEPEESLEEPDGAAIQEPSDELGELEAMGEDDGAPPDDEDDPPLDELDQPEVNYDPPRDELTLQSAERHWRLRGLRDARDRSRLQVNLLVSRPHFGTHVDVIDLYRPSERASFLGAAAAELAVGEVVLRHDLGRVLLAAEQARDEQLGAAEATAPAEPTMSAAERNEAEELLTDPALLDRVVADLDRIGLVGERTNKLMGYLAATSRLLDQPLAIMVQSSSAAGKSTLMDGLLQMMPPEQVQQFSALTGQSLYYLGREGLQHKILAIAEDEGARRAGYALKLLQSERQLKLATAGRDPKSARMVTESYQVLGPVMVMVTTTQIEVDAELLNRCLVLTVDEGRAQTKAILERQRLAQTLTGLEARQEREQLVTLHRNAQRLLRPVTVVNPFAPRLTFDHRRTRARRDHTKYLSLIRTIALLHQRQRPARHVESANGVVDYIEVEPTDIAVANELVHEVLGRSLDDLPPQTRRLLGLLDRWVGAECERRGCDRSELHFTRREAREQLGWGHSQLRVHLARLAELEYVLIHGRRRGRTLQYELVWDGAGRDGTPRYHGLIDLAALGVDASGRPAADAPGQQQAGGRRGQNGPKTGGGWTGSSASNGACSNGFSSSTAEAASNTSSAATPHAATATGQRPSQVNSHRQDG